MWFNIAVTNHTGGMEWGSSHSLSHPFKNSKRCQVIKTNPDNLSPILELLKSGKQGKES